MDLARDLLHALDAACFTEDVLGMPLDPWQRDVLSSPAPRLLLNITRQGGKSTTAAAKALHQAIYQPGSLSLIVSPSLRQSTEMYRKVTDLAAQLDAPPAMTEDTKTSTTLENGSRIVSLPSSEATIRGYSSVDLLIFDEAARVSDVLYKASRPFVAVSGGSIVAMSTPFGKRGWWWDAFQNGGEDWQRVTVTAYECPRISPAFLEEEQRSLGPLWFKSEYLCKFAESIDSVFRFEDIQNALDDDIVPLFGRKESA